METIFFLINELSYFEYLKPQIELHWHTNVVLVTDFWSFRLGLGKGLYLQKKDKIFVIRNYPLGHALVLSM